MRLNVSRCFISFFDRNYQHVVAEATQSLSLTPDAQLDPKELRLSGSALPRYIKCPNEHVLESLPTIQHEDASDKAFTPLLPVLVVPDLAQDERFSDSFHRLNWPQTRFYAGVPIRSRKGIHVGVYHVFDDSPRSELDFGDTNKQFLRDMADIVWHHVESQAAIERIHRGERMVRGLGSFVEGRATLSSSTGQFQDAPGQDEGALNQRQQGLQRDLDAIEDPTPQQEREHYFGTRSPDRRSASRDTSPPAAPKADGLQSTVEAPAQNIAVNAFPHRPVSVTVPDPHVVQLKQAFSRAANILRESVEVQGALFLDASVGSFGGLVEDRKSRDSTDSNGWAASTASSSNEDVPKSTSLPHTGEPVPYCDVFGYSTTGASSIDGAASFSKHTLVPEPLLKSLLRRYPAGKIFSFDTDGLLLSGESDTDDAKSTSSQRTNPPSDAKGKRRPNRPFSSLEGQAQAITALFPGARSVAVFPLWDQVKERWFAGGFIWTASSHRLFSTEGELSYLRAYATTVMGEVHRLNALNSDQVKGDFLSSLSHELRSPLHGVIAAVDLLHGTTLDVFQGDAIHIVETSGRTLLDTLDHVGLPISLQPPGFQLCSYLANAAVIVARSQQSQHFHDIFEARPERTSAVTIWVRRRTEFDRAWNDILDRGGPGGHSRGRGCGRYAIIMRTIDHHSGNGIPGVHQFHH